jgi:hypothetical protein
MNFIDAWQGAWEPKILFFILPYFILYKVIPGIFFVEMLKVADIVLGI